MRPCDRCSFPVDIGTLMRNFRFCKEEVCNRCMRSINQQERKRLLNKKWSLKTQKDSNYGRTFE